MTINLNWREEKTLHNIYYYASIWQNQRIEISHNGDDFYNVVVIDGHGDETDEICGHEVLSIAKENAKKWIKQQIQPLISEKI